MYLTETKATSRHLSSEYLLARAQQLRVLNRGVSAYILFLHRFLSIPLEVFLYLFLIAIVVNIVY
jgi:hypothetical protein